MGVFATGPIAKGREHVSSLPLLLLVLVSFGGAVRVSQRVNGWIVSFSDLLCFGIGSVDGSGRFQEDGTAAVNSKS